jgi:hypothetical protein
LAVLLVTVTALTVGLAATPAYAANGDWRTFRTTCQASWCVNNGNLVRLWQAVLWADGKFSSTTDIDGAFGPRSHSATRAWQNSWGADDDGEVGPITWGRAQEGRLDLDPNGDICSGGYYHYTYHGYGPSYPNYRNFRLRMRCSDLHWFFQNPRTGAWTDTTYNY